MKVTKIMMWVGLLGLSCPVLAVTERATTLLQENIYKYRAHSIIHSNPKAQNMHMLFVNGLSDGCLSLYYYADKDPFLHSAVMSAVLKRERVTVIYDVEQATRGPWGDTTSCMLTSITIEK